MKSYYIYHRVLEREYFNVSAHHGKIHWQTLGSDKKGQEETIGGTDHSG
jgi:hypothetical protein